jgi:hypothetical protein
MLKRLLILLFAVGLPAVTLAQSEAICDLKWEWIGNFPDYQINAKPQGLTFYDGTVKTLIYSAHYEEATTKVDHGSKVFFIPISSFPLDDEKLSNLKSFSLPKEHSHVAGLAMDGATLFGADYRTNQVLRISFSFEDLEKDPTYEFTTSAMKGLSGMDFLCQATSDLFILSEFKLNPFAHCSTAFFTSEEKMHKESFQPQESYVNKGYSQGLTFASIDGLEYVIESLNKGLLDPFGFKPKTDEIRMYDLQSLLNGSDEKTALRAKFPTPGTMVQDLAWDGEYLYTSDEHKGSMGFYRGKFINCQ